MRAIFALLGICLVSAPTAAQTGGTLNNTVIGGTTPAPGTFTSIGATATTASTSTTTGTIVDAGGLGVVGSIYAGATSFITMPQIDGNRFEVDRDASALNYTGTHAALVVQQRDAENLSAGATIPGAIFQFNATGNGVVSLPRTSESIWWGLTATMNKTGDASAQIFTGIGQLGAVGPTGYNELGGSQGTLTNVGSTNGNMSGFEWQLVDGNYDTRMAGVVSRMNRKAAGSQLVTAFEASSEGSQPPDDVLTLNTSAYNQWKTGIDLSSGTFTTGVSMYFPNNTSLNWLPASGPGGPILFVSSANQTILRPVTSAGEVCLQNYAGTSVLCQASLLSVIQTHQESTGSTPSVSGAGSGAFVAGNDNAGRITTGTTVTTTISLTFATSWTHQAICRASDESTPTVVLTENGVTGGAYVNFHASTAPTNADVISYECTGYQ